MSRYRRIREQHRQATELANTFCMDKIEFAKWIPKIKEDWPKGTYVTLSMIPYVPDRIPSPLFVVGDVIEIHYLAPIDEQRKQPRCIYVCSTVTKDAGCNYAPGALRKLTSEELKLVDARNQAPAETEPVSGSGSASDSAEHYSG